MRTVLLTLGALGGCGDGGACDDHGISWFFLPKYEINCDVSTLPPSVYHPADLDPTPVDDSFRGDGATDEFFLSLRPDLDTLDITVDSGVYVLTPTPGEGVEYDLVRNSLVFEPAPPDAATIRIEYVPAELADP